MGIEETALAGARRSCLNALRRSLGDAQREAVFSDWLARQPAAHRREPPGPGSIRIQDEHAHRAMRRPASPCAVPGRAAR